MESGRTAEMACRFVVCKHLVCQDLTAVCVCVCVCSDLCFGQSLLQRLSLSLGLQQPLVELHHVALQRRQRSQMQLHAHTPHTHTHTHTHTHITARRHKITTCTACFSGELGFYINISCSEVCNNYDFLCF